LQSPLCGLGLAIIAAGTAGMGIFSSPVIDKGTVTINANEGELDQQLLSSKQSLDLQVPHCIKSARCFNQFFLAEFLLSSILFSMQSC
jgi:hypothetical protein